MVFGFQQLLSLFSSGLHIKQYIWFMISIPYGKPFYLQATCQTKHRNKKSSSALRRNKIQKNNVRTPLLKYIFKVHFRHLWGMLYHREWDVGLGSREECQEYRKVRGNYGKMYHTPLKHSSQKLGKNTCFCKSS